MILCTMFNQLNYPMRRTIVRIHRKVSLVHIMLLFVSVLGGCASHTPPKPTGKITKFTVTPEKVCINEDTNVRVTFKADSSSNQCVKLFLNDEAIISGFAGGPVSDPINRCGSGNWGETYTFDLKDVYNANIPPTIHVRLELAEQTATGLSSSSVLDQEEIEITTNICP